MKRSLGEILVLGIAILVLVGVPGYFVREALLFVADQYGPNAATMAAGMGIALLTFIGGGLFTYRIIKRAQIHMLDAFDSMGETVRTLSGVQKVNAQAALIDQRQTAEAERRFQALVDQRVRMLTAGQGPAAPAAASVPSWALADVDSIAAPAAASAAGGGPRYVE